jgi:hypothetical protein
MVHIRFVSAFRPWGVPGPTSKLLLRVPSQMGRRETEHKGEQKREPRLVLSCTQGGWACSRGLQAFARERESLCVSSSSRAATSSYEGPGPSFYRCKEQAQVYNGERSNVLTCLAERSQNPMYMPTWLSKRFWRPVHVMLWPSEERLRPMEAQLSGLSGPCWRLLASVRGWEPPSSWSTRGAIITCSPGRARWDADLVPESAFIPFVSFGDLDNNTFKCLTSLLSVEQEIQYDEHTWIVYND